MSFLFSLLPVIWMLFTIVGAVVHNTAIVVPAAHLGANGQYPEEVRRMVRERLQKLRANTMQHMDGTWSSWSTWSPCSRSCGGGVAVQSRQCISRPQDSRLGRGRRRRRLEPSKGVNQCVGLYKRHQLCNEQECPGGHQDFRAEQCTVYNARPFKGKTFSWEPYHDAKLECELNCRAIGHEFYATLNKTVHDGTSCRRPFTALGKAAIPGTRGVCVEGRCMSVGLGGVLGSDIRQQSLDPIAPASMIASPPSNDGDTCSACDVKTSGGAPRCRLVSGLFTRPQMPPGYTPIATLPKGACHVNITQMQPSRNYLALRNPDGSYIFNGNWAINWSGTYNGAGAFFYYRRQDHVNGESISGIGPLLHHLDLILIYQAPNPGIKYEYKIPLGTPIPMGEQIAPPLLDTRHLDRPAASGHNNQADEAPKSVTHPVHRTSTKPRRKKFAWKVSTLTPCSKTCGGGTQTASVICVREHTQVPVQERRCAHLEKPPVYPVRCAQQPCPARWTPGEWSSCSAQCGQGEQTRTMECVQEISSKLTMMVNEGACLEAKPDTKRACFVKECSDEDEEISSNDLSPEGDVVSKPYWRTGPWSQCSTTCGLGQRTRLVTCVGLRLPGSECTSEQRPVISIPCEESRCPIDSDHVHKSHSFILTNNNTIPTSWFFTEWSQHCSEDCGTGSQYRSVSCLDPNSCPEDLKPDTSRACSSDKQCGGKWFTGPWGRCNGPCGKYSTQKRDVVCVVYVRGQSRIVNEKTCSFDTKPESERSCGEACGPQWFTNDWTECEGNCDGSATQKRDIRCLEDNERDSNTCDNQDRPSVKRTCEPRHCRSRETNGGSRTIEAHDEPALDSSCIDKFPLCQAAVQARLCQYRYYQTSCCLSCRRAPEIPRD